MPAPAHALHVHLPLPHLSPRRAQASAAALYRVYAGLHTIAQVGVGSLIGSAFAAGWRQQLQPPLARSLAHIEEKSFSGLVLVLALAGVAVVGSVERHLFKPSPKGKAV
jgi:hypothetical protein